MFIRSTIYYFAMCLSVFIVGFFLLIFGYFLKQTTIDSILHCWSKTNRWLLKFICGLDIEVRGGEKLCSLDYDIVISNHQSVFETIVFRALLPKSQTWVLKKELLKIPFYNIMVKFGYTIPVDRSNGKEALKDVMAVGSKALSENRVVFVFPEGTRSLPGEHLKYNAGAALLAVKNNANVLPMAHNAGVYWPKKGYVINPGQLTVSIGDVVSSQDKKSRELMSELECWVQSESDSLMGASS